MVITEKPGPFVKRPSKEKKKKKDSSAMSAGFGVTTEAGSSTPSQFTTDGSVGLIRAVSKVQIVSEHKGPVG